MAEENQQGINLAPETVHTIGVGLGASVLAWLMQARVHSEQAWESALRVVLGDVYAGDAPLLGALGRLWLELRWTLGADGEGIALLAELNGLSAGLAAALLYRALLAWLKDPLWALSGVGLAVATNAWWGTAVSWGPLPALVPLSLAAWRLAEGLTGARELDRRWLTEVGIALGVAATLDRSALWLLPGVLFLMYRRGAVTAQLTRLAGAALAPFIVGMGIGTWLDAVAGDTPPLPTMAAQDQTDAAMARLAGTDSASFSGLLTPLGSLVDTGETFGLIAALVPLAGLVSLGALAWRHRSRLQSIDLALPVLAALPLALLESAVGSAVPVLALVPLGTLAVVALTEELGTTLSRPRRASLGGVAGIAAFMALANVATHLAASSRWSVQQHISAAGDTYFPSESEAGSVLGATRSFPEMNTGGAMMDPGMSGPGMGGPGMGGPGMGGPGMGGPGMGGPGMGGPGMGGPGMGGPGMGGPGMGPGMQMSQPMPGSVPPPPQ